MGLRFVSKLGDRLKLAKDNPSKTFNIDTEPDPIIRSAMIEIYEKYGHVVENNYKRLRKYGLSRQVQQNTPTLIMTNKTGVFAEVLPTTNSIDSVVCSGYTGSFDLEYHTIDGSGNKTFDTQTVNVVAGVGTLETPCARVSTAENFTAALTADLYIYENSSVTAGVPDDGTKIHLKVEQAANHSLKCATTVEQNKYWIIDTLYGSVNTKTSAFCKATLFTKNGDLVSENRYEGGLINGAQPPLEVPGLIIVKPNEDAWVSGTADQNRREMSFGAAGYLLEIRG